MNQDIRWKQRFQNFDHAFRLLQEALANGPDTLSALEKEGVIQRFEYSFELAWKTIKDYLEAEGVTLTMTTPRHTLKEAFSAGLLANGEVWIKMLDHRNLLSHTYDLAVFESVIEEIIKTYLPAMSNLYQFFLNKTKA